MIRKIATAALFSGTLALSGAALAAPTTYSGVTFPDGDISFADIVISYAPGGDVASPHNDATRSLGTPNGAFTSLGDNGVLIVQFTDNSLTTSGDSTADLHIFEVGAAIEVFNVAISQNLSTWINLGNVLGQPTSIDIDGVVGVVPFAQYSYVRLTDVSPNQSGSPFGEADIDAIGAISSAPPVSVPGPAALALLGFGMIGIRLFKTRA